MKFQRGCGILMPVSSLASEYGIGCLSKEAYEFVDFLEKSGQGYWQVLPFGPTKTLEHKYTTETIIKTLQNLNFVELIGKGYIPTYERTEITDSLHEKFGFRTDTEIVPRNCMKKIFYETRNPKYCALQD